MPHQAWLDSLSEDWVSQPGSDTSQLQHAIPSSPSVFASSAIENTPNRASRIPRLTGASPGIKRPQYQPYNSSPSVLSERNPNDINIKAAQLGPSKLSQETKLSSRRRYLSRSASTSTADSVIHNSILQSKSQGASPSKGSENAPEWRRRLLYGELEYGESMDLFSSAATGLENIFRPPQAPEDPNDNGRIGNEGHTVHETTLPSSPPRFSGDRRDVTDDDSDNIGELPSCRSSVQYKAALPDPTSFLWTDKNGAEVASDNVALANGENCDKPQTQPNGIAETSSMSLRKKHLLDESRKISGQSDLRNEDFSPIFIARRSSEDGTVSFAPMELPVHQLRNKLEILQRNQMILDPESDGSLSQHGAIHDGAGDFENTDNCANSSVFPKLQGVERLVDGSFYRRSLSPSLNMDFSEILQESSLQASTPKQFPTVRTDRFVSGGDKRGSSSPGSPLSPGSPSLPRAPYTSPDKRPRTASIKTSSPLKLFGPYDTFTNQTLLRRISQFEDQQSNKSHPYVADGTAPSTIPFPYTESKPRDEVTGSPIPLTRKPPQFSSGNRQPLDSVNNFGGGELDTYEFEGDVSLCSSIPINSEEKENEMPPQSHFPLADSFRFDIHEDSLSDGESLVVKQHRYRASRSASSTRCVRVSKSLDGLRPRMPTGLRGASSWFPSTAIRKSSEGKRPRTSPSKDPTPKRRRTLHRSDIAYGLDDWRTAMETVQSSHYTMQSAITRDRKYARQIELQKLVDVGAPNKHHVLRPRSSTPRQRASEVRDRLPLADIGFRPVSAPAQAPISREDMEIQGANGFRKVSMRTQDFFDAAEEVMAMIRNKARPVAGLASVEESEAENSGRPIHNHSSVTEDSFQESTQEPFSRPPSRDGQPILRLPTRQEDPKLVIQLKKYEENGNLVDIMSESLGSMGTLQTNDQLSHSTSSTDLHDCSSDLGAKAYDGNGVISDIPNIRISGNPQHTQTNQSIAEFPFGQSQSSGGSSRRSVPTTASSRGSDSRRLIAPDVVAQLIGNQVGNMVFDDVHKMWQKVKARRKTVSILPSEDSEDDPFASIPDLTVDSVKERRHLDLSIGKSRPNFDGDLQNDSSLGWPSSKEGKTTENSINSEHFARDNVQTHVETPVEDDEEIDHEISLHEDRIHKGTPSHRKNLTITFSSPIASIIQDARHRDMDSGSYETESNSEYSLGNITVDSVKRDHQGMKGRSVSGMATSSSSQSRIRGVSRNFSLERRTFIPRPVSRIEEQDENASGEQHVERNGQTQIGLQVESEIVASESEPMGNPDLSVVMATPDPARTAAVLPTPIIGQYIGTFSLSPMSEFTVHQLDHSCALEVSYVVGDRYFVTGDGSKKTMSKAVRSLVEKITEVQPFEPDWESVPELDLSNKQLDTLHMLDEFCASLVTLNASNNTISHLDGVPQSVRNLRMTHNLLSELTAWGQLTNLQYIDISNNQIKSLSAFKDLVHLRAIRADNNQITSLDGIKFHDSLQVLRARGNLIKYIDFDGTKMQRLTELDLENNQIVAFENWEQLTSLCTLNLEHNRLTSFSPSGGQSSLSLRFLKLSNNDLETLDLAVLPSLRLLHVDHNNITTITGLPHCRRLDSLSLREQKGEFPLDTSFLDSACEVRKLFLSGNRLSGFKPGVDFLNLQYLELANCGLESLAPNVGQLMPNLRMLNINFNAINDLWPLRYIPRLKKLLVAGNRLSEARKVAVALAEFPHLSRLDLRDNSATLGFYAPVQALAPPENDEKQAEFDPFVLPDVDVERQQKFASRLDMSTRMRKRIYDMIVLNSCRQLKTLDGLPASKDILSAKDDVWKELVRSGIVEAGEEEPENLSAR